MIPRESTGATSLSSMQDGYHQPSRAPRRIAAIAAIIRLYDNPATLSIRWRLTAINPVIIVDA
jgi:hypothetical protein